MLPGPDPAEPPPDLRALAAADGDDPLAARWERSRRELLQEAAYRPFRPIAATRVALREATPVELPASGVGRSFGSLVHQILEWIPFDEPGRARPMAEALAPRFGLDAEGAQRAAAAVERTLGLPVIARALRAARVFRELPLVFPEESDLVEGVVDLVFEEDGELVVVDYKSDGIAPEQAIDQAAHHAPQLRLYGRGLTQATGLPVRERLVVFTSLGREVRV
jgi:ATP-dependent exoDNAse (exonuclease V) beta subunit